MGDVAAAVGVSKTTISRYLHGNFGYRGVSGGVEVVGGLG